MIAAARFLCARAGRHRVAFAVGDVQEVLAPRALTRLFHVPPSVLGVVNLRGEILPVVDLAQMLGDLAEPDGPEARLLVLRAPLNGRTVPLGALVGSLDPLHDARSDAVGPLPEGLPEPSARLGRAVVRDARIDASGAAALVIDVAALAALDVLVSLRAG